MEKIVFCQSFLLDGRVWIGGVYLKAKIQHSKTSIELDKMVVRRYGIREVLSRIALVVFGLIISFILVELILRIYNPFPIRLKGDQIVLPINLQTKFSNKYFADLDKEIIHTKNSLGFRGEDLPQNFNDYLSIIAIGGSTTECTLISDNKDWPAILNQELDKQFSGIWVNNAGLNGHSTFGHQVLLDDHVSKLHPNIILYLVGCNEVDRNDLSKFDKTNNSKYASGLKNYALKKSELLNLVYNFSLYKEAQKRELTHRILKFEEPEYLDYDSTFHNQEMVNQKKLLSKYRDRLDHLVKSTIEYNIKPVLITQPTILGYGIDDRSGADLERLKFLNRNGKTYWLILEEYNKITKEIADKYKVLCIDLASELPKSSYYFYDFIHFTPKGTAKVGKIISKYLSTWTEEMKK